MADNIGIARGTLVLDTADFQVAIAGAQRKMQQLGETGAAAYASLEGRQKRSADALLNYANQLTRSTDSIRLYRAAEAGVPQDVWETAAKQIAQYQQGVEMAADYMSDLTARTKAQAQAQQQANAFLEQLSDKVNTSAFNSDDVLRYRAALLGVSTAAEPLIQHLAQVRAETELMGKATGINSYFDSLQSQISAFGKSASELRELQAAAAGASDVVQPLLNQLAELERQQEATAALMQEASAIDRLRTSLQESVATFGMSSTELRQWKADLVGAGDTINPIIRQLEALEAAQIQFNEAFTNASAINSEFDRLTAAVNTFGMSAEQMATFRAEAMGATEQLQPLIQKLSQLEATQQKLNADYAEASAMNSWLDGLRRQTDLLGKSRSEILAYEAAERGMTDEAAPLIAAFKAKQDALDAEGKSLGNATDWNERYQMSNRNLQFQLRMLPAQFTDVFTSLAGGQSPLLVLIQQGGQIKDMFGGIGNAVQIVGRELLALAVNPVVLLATAAAGLGYAWYEADERATAFNKTVALQGAALGVTTTQLQAMASTVASATNTSMGSAQDLVNSVAGTGQLMANQIEQVSTGIEELSNLTGKTTDSLISQFAKLNDDPVAAMQDLNKNIAFVTAGLYEQVSALQQSGNTQQAATLVLQAWSKAVSDAAASTGTQTTALKTLGAEFGNLAASVGENMGLLAVSVQNSFKNNSSGPLGVLGGLWNAINPLTFSQTVKSTYDQLHGVVQAGSKSVTDAAASGADDAGSVMSQAGVALLASSDKVIEQGKKKSDQMADEIKSWKAKFQTALNDAFAQGDTQSFNVLLTQMDKTIAAVKEKYTKAKPTGAGFHDYDLSTYTNEQKQQLGEIDATTTALKAAYQNRQISAEQYYSIMQNLAQAQADTISKTDQAQIDYLKHQQQTPQVLAKIRDLQTDMSNSQAKASATVVKLAAEQQQAYQKDTLAVQEYGRALDAQNLVLQRQISNRVATIGLGSRESQYLQDQVSLYTRQSDAQDKLQRQLSTGQITQTRYQQEMDVLSDKTAAGLNLISDGYQKVSDAQADWRNGVHAALDDITDDSNNLANYAKTMTTTLSDGFTTAFQNLAKNGKLSFSDLATSIENQLIKLGTNKLFSSLLAMAMGSSSSFAGSGSSLAGIISSAGGGGSGFNLATAGTGSGFSFFANGAAFDNTPSLSQYSGNVYNSPTYFQTNPGVKRFANGGVFGEAGPEAIMPLTRGANGKLGVAASGGGGGNVTINVHGAPPGTTTKQSQDQNGNFQFDVLINQVEQRMASNVMAGTSPLAVSFQKTYALKRQ